MTSARSDTGVDNDLVRVAIWSFEPGQSTGEHLHEHDYVVVTDGITRVRSGEREDDNEMRKGGC